MTVSSTTNKALHTGNNVVVSFPFTYRLDNESDMTVWLDEVEQSTGFTVNINPDNIGGTVDFSVAPDSGVLVTLLRVVPETQETDYTPYDSFPAEAHEDALDKLTMLVQQIVEEIERTVTAPVGGDPSVSYEMPPYSAGAAITWSLSGDKELINSDFPLQTYVDDAAASAAAADISEANAASSQASCTTLALSAQTSANAASSDATAALASKDAAALSEAAAETARDFAQEWAKNPVNVLIDDGVNPTDYSAYHYAQQAKVLDSESLTAIDKLVNASSVLGVFLYIPSIHDDDNGVWISSANWQSWHSEALNTATRGATRKLPKGGLLGIIESDKVTLHDLGESDVPMWKVLYSNVLSSSGFGVFRALATYPLDGSVSVKNGVMYFGINTGAENNNAGVHYFDFKNDLAGKVVANTTYSGATYPLIDYKNNDIVVNDNIAPIISSIINDIAITSDGNGNNIIYVATDGGLSRIAPDGSVSNWTDTSGSNANKINNIAIFDGYVYCDAWVSADGLFIQSFDINIPLTPSHYSGADTSHFVGANWEGWVVSARIPYHFDGLNLITQAIANRAIGSDYALTKLYPNPDDWGASMIANITADFNSGILWGDIRGAWLADTDDTDLVGSELIINGDFETALGAEWVAHNSGILSITAGVFKILNGSPSFGSAVQNFTTVIGETYTITLDVVNTSVGTASLRISTNDVNGGTGDILDILGTLSANSTYIFTFKAISTTTYVRLFGNGVLDDFAEFDNVSVRLADADRSYKNNGLAVHGTVQRTPVATGAELVWYSGFSAVNFLKQTGNSDIGITDFGITLHFNVESHSGAQFFLETSTGDTISTGIACFVNTSGQFVVRIAGVDECIADISYGKDTTAFIKRVGSDVSLFLDKVLVATSISASSLIANDTITIGAHPDGTSPAVNASLALIRFGASTATSKQIATIVEQEEPMFQENAKVTLQGSSSDVKAVDHDDSNNLLTACSEDHITRFNGLVVVDDWAEEATSISTVCDKEATGV